MKKKIIALILFVMIFGLQINLETYAETYDISKVVFVSGPTFGNIDVNENGVDIQDEKFKTNLNFSYKWITVDDNKVYNDELAKAAILLATDMYNDTYVSETNAYGKSEQEVTEQKESFTEAISTLNLDDIKYIKYEGNDIQTQDKDDVTGVTVGHKDVNIDGKDYTLFIAVLDTTQGATEWKSNFDIGADIDDYYAMTNTTKDDHPFWIHKYNHKGFDVAANRAKTLIDSYINDHRTDGFETTLLLCGHSRGGAISNILGSLYEDDDSIKSYTYTFGTPGTVEICSAMPESKISSYKTIFNHVNEDDFVTLVPNEAWGFRRYGTTLKLKLSDYNNLGLIYDAITYAPEQPLMLLGAQNDITTGLGKTPELDADDEEVKPLLGFLMKTPEQPKYKAPYMHETGTDDFIGIADALSSALTNRKQVYAKQTKTLTFDTKDNRDAYLSGMVKTCMNYANTDKFKMYSNKDAGYESLDDFTVKEEYYYAYFLETFADLLGNRTDMDGFAALIKLLTLSLVANEAYDNLADGVTNMSFSQGYYLEKKLYDLQMSILGNMNYLAGPHMTAAYVVMSYFRDANDLNVSYDESQIYTGSEIKPEVNFEGVDSKWIKDTDYTLNYLDNIEVTDNAKIKINSKKMIPTDVTLENFIEKVNGFNLVGNLTKGFEIFKPTSYSLKKIDVSENSNTSKTNTIKNTDDDKKGTVVLTSSKVKKGSKVKFEVIPSDGYKVKEVVVTDKNGKVLEVSNIEGNNFEFTMPNSNIDIDVKYELKTEEELQIENEIKDINESLQIEGVKLSNSNEGKNINSDAKFIKGYDTGEFKPESKVSNIELMSMITSLYTDVQIKTDKVNLNQGENYWGEEIVKKAFSLNLIPGDKDNKNYDLNKGVTRGELAVVIYNLLKDYNNEGNINQLSDIAGKPYEKEVTKLISLGIIKGYEDGLFHGEKTLTRAEAVTIINRTLKSLGFEIKLNNLKVSFPDLNKTHWAYSEIMFAANK